MKFSDYQLAMIKKAKALGYGYAIFACSVEKQGFCTPKQEKALRNMVAVGEYRKNNWKSTYGTRPKSKSLEECGLDISDCEAMKSGDYF